MIVTVRSYPAGPRVWILGQRVHHGTVGLGLVALGLRRRPLAMLGVLLAMHDRRDWRVWLAREACPMSSCDEVTLDSELSTP